MFSCYSISKNEHFVCKRVLNFKVGHIVDCRVLLYVFDPLVFITPKRSFVDTFFFIFHSCYLWQTVNYLNVFVPKKCNVGAQLSNVCSCISNFPWENHFICSNIHFSRIIEIEVISSWNCF